MEIPCINKVTHSLKLVRFDPRSEIYAVKQKKKYKRVMIATWRFHGRVVKGVEGLVNVELLFIIHKKGISISVFTKKK